MDSFTTLHILLSTLMIIGFTGLTVMIPLSIWEQLFGNPAPICKVMTVTMALIIFSVTNMWFIKEEKMSVSHMLISLLIIGIPTIFIYRSFRPESITEIPETNLEPNQENTRAPSETTETIPQKTTTQALRLVELE